MTYKVCYAPGYDKGPDRTGEEPSTFLCELPGGHEGDHAWDEDYDGTFATTWPVTDDAPDGA